MNWKAKLKTWAQKFSSPRTQISVSEQSSNTVADTRLTPRLQEQLWVTLPDIPIPAALTKDWSLGGCRLEGDFRQHLGHQSTMYLDLKDSEAPIKLVGKFVWADHIHCGVRFLNLHRCDEIRMLQCLGEKKQANSSNFLPQGPRPKTTNSFCLTRTEDGQASLYLELANWKVRMEFDDLTFQGKEVGDFYDFEVSDARQRGAYKLVLMDQRRQPILDLTGQDIGFERKPNRPEVVLAKEDIR